MARSSPEVPKRARRCCVGQRATADGHGIVGQTSLCVVLRLMAAALVIAPVTVLVTPAVGGSRPVAPGYTIPAQLRPDAAESRRITLVRRAWSKSRAAESLIPPNGQVVSQRPRPRGCRHILRTREERAHFRPQQGRRLACQPLVSVPAHRAHGRAWRPPTRSAACGVAAMTRHCLADLRSHDRVHGARSRRTSEYATPAAPPAAVATNDPGDVGNGLCLAVSAHDGHPVWQRMVAGRTHEERQTPGGLHEAVSRVRRRSVRDLRP